MPKVDKTCRELIGIIWQKMERELSISGRAFRPWYWSNLLEWRWDGGKIGWKCLILLSNLKKRWARSWVVLKSELSIRGVPWILGALVFLLLLVYRTLSLLQTWAWISECSIWGHWRSLWDNGVTSLKFWKKTINFGFCIPQICLLKWRQNKLSRKSSDSWLPVGLCFKIC